MVKIAVDATPLTIPSGGVRRYTDELSRALAECYPEDEVWLLSDQRFEVPSRAPANLKAARGPRNLLERRWWLWGLATEISRLRIEVFHGVDFAVPYLPLRPAVMTLHDLSPWMDPSWHMESQRVRNRTPTLLRLGLSTMVITPSEAVRRQALHRFHLEPSRVVAIPLAAGGSFHPVPQPRSTPAYLLYVGTIEPRKNIPLLIEIWRELRKHHAIDLVLAGRRREDFPEIKPEPGLHLKGLTLEEDLPTLYSGALAAVYPSYYEGFGLPVLEAMQCGAAVVASRDPAIAEVVGDAAILVDVNNKPAWFEALESLIANPDHARTLAEKAVIRAAGFSWIKTARLTREVYGHAVERFRKKT